MIPDDPNDPNHGLPADARGVLRGLLWAMPMMMVGGYLFYVCMRWFLINQAPIRLP